MNEEHELETGFDAMAVIANADAHDDPLAHSSDDQVAAANLPGAEDARQAFAKAFPNTPGANQAPGGAVSDLDAIAQSTLAGGTVAADHVDEVQSSSPPADDHVDDVQSSSPPADDEIKPPAAGFARYANC
jgi:hypothetical protein